MAKFTVTGTSRVFLNGVEIGSGTVYPITVAPDDVITACVDVGSTRTREFVVHPWAPRDDRPFDDFPDDCWRCDAADAADDLGLCVDCRDDLLG